MGVGGGMGEGGGLSFFLSRLWSPSESDIFLEYEISIRTLSAEKIMHRQELRPPPSPHAPFFPSKKPLGNTTTRGSRFGLIFGVTVAICIFVVVSPESWEHGAAASET